MKTLFTLFSVVFILWVLFGAAFNDATADKKKKKSEGNNGAALLGLLFAPFVLMGWILFGLGQLLYLLMQALAALWELLTPLFRKLFEMIGKILERLWALLKKILRNVLPFLRKIFDILRYAFKTLWNALSGIAHAVSSMISSLLSFAKDLIRDFPGVIRTFRKILKPFGWLLRMLRDAFGKMLDWLFFLMDGLFAMIGRGNERTKKYVTRDIDEADPTEAADLLMAVPLAVATVASRTKKRRRGKEADTARTHRGLIPKLAHLSATDPLKKGVTHKRKKNDPHVLDRLQSIGWETRRKMGRTGNI